jgi:hypothetical protein
MWFVIQPVLLGRVIALVAQLWTDVMMCNCSLEQKSAGIALTLLQNAVSTLTYLLSIVHGVTIFAVPNPDEIP